MILAFFHGYAHRRLALLILWNFRRSPSLLLSAVTSLFFYEIRQVCRSKWAQRNDLTHAATRRCLTLFVFEHGLRDHRHPVIAIMIILQNTSNITCRVFWLVCLVCLWYINFGCMTVLGLNHHIFGWSVSWLKKTFFFSSCCSCLALCIAARWHGSGRAAHWLLWWFLWCWTHALLFSSRYKYNKTNHIAHEFGLNDKMT